MKERRRFITAQIGIFFYVVAQLLDTFLSSVLGRVDSIIINMVVLLVAPFTLIITFFATCPAAKLSIPEVGELKKPIKPISLLLIPLIAFFLLVVFNPIANWLAMLLEKITGRLLGRAIEPFDPFGRLSGITLVGTVFFAILSSCILPALGEELMFRGAIFSGFRTLGASKAVLLSALLFSLFHVNIHQTVYQFVLGVILAIFVLVSGSIVASILLHFLNNLYVTIYHFIISPKIDGALANFGNYKFITDILAIIVGVIILIILIYSFYYINRVTYTDHVVYTIEGDDVKVTTNKVSFGSGLGNWFKYMFTKRGIRRVNLALDSYNVVPYLGTNQPMLSVYIVFALTGARWVAEVIIYFMGY